MPDTFSPMLTQTKKARTEKNPSISRLFWLRVLNKQFLLRIEASFPIICTALFSPIFYPRESHNRHHQHQLHSGFEGTGISLLRVSADFRMQFSLTECFISFLHLCTSLYPHRRKYNSDAARWQMLLEDCQTSQEHLWECAYCVCVLAIPACQMVRILYSAGFGRAWFFINMLPHSTKYFLFNSGDEY